MIILPFLNCLLIPGDGPDVYSVRRGYILFLVLSVFIMEQDD